MTGTPGGGGRKPQTSAPWSAHPIGKMSPLLIQHLPAAGSPRHAEPIRRSGAIDQHIINGGSHRAGRRLPQRSGTSSPPTAARHPRAGPSKHARPADTRRRRRLSLERRRGPPRTPASHLLAEARTRPPTTSRPARPPAPPHKPPGGPRGSGQTGTCRRNTTQVISVFIRKRYCNNGRLSHTSIGVLTTHLEIREIPVGRRHPMGTQYQHTGSQSVSHCHPTLRIYRNKTSL